jgi:hypothetical protein
MKRMFIKNKMKTPHRKKQKYPKASLGGVSVIIALKSVSNCLDFELKVMSKIFLLLFLIFLKQSRYVAQYGLEILLPQPLECWDDRCGL